MVSWAQFLRCWEIQFIAFFFFFFFTGGEVGESNTAECAANICNSFTRSKNIHTHTHTITNCQQQLVFVFPSIQTSPLSQRTWLIFSALIHCAAAPRWLTDWLIHFTLSKTWIVHPQLDSARQPERTDNWRKPQASPIQRRESWEEVWAIKQPRGRTNHTLTSQQINTGRHVGHQKPSPCFLLWRSLCQSVYCSLIETRFHSASWALITT